MTKQKSQHSKNVTPISFNKNPPSHCNIKKHPLFASIKNPKISSLPKNKSTPSSQIWPTQNLAISETDRYIPHRLIHDSNQTNRKSPSTFKVPTRQKLIFSTPKPSKFTPRIFSPNSTAAISHQTLRRALFSPDTLRTVDTTPYRILDAPGLHDDFYLSLLSWSSQNFISVALSRAVYLYSVDSNETHSLFPAKETDSLITSLQWNPKNSNLSIGRSNGVVELWDTHRASKISSHKFHFSRVGTLSWGDNVLASGSKDRSIVLFDTRCSGFRNGGNCIRRLRSHKQEICGLNWHPFNGNQLASGGNDNALFVWDIKMGAALKEFHEHTAAVKALDWSPHQSGLLVSGGGSMDNSLRFWNTNLGGSRSVYHIDSKSQVCNLKWSRNSKEFVSTHGYSKNWIKVYKYSGERNVEKVAKFEGHKGRILQLAMSPDGKSIVTGAADETLKFWKIFPALNSSFNNEGRIRRMNVLSECRGRRDILR